MIPVINVIGGKDEKRNNDNYPARTSQGQSQQRQGSREDQPQDEERSEPTYSSDKTPEQLAADQQARFAIMRQQLLGQDARID